jgi:hypothetical protein
MSLNLSEMPARPVSLYSASQSFTDAVNDSRYVRTFGVIALIGALPVALISGTIGAGLGLAVAAFGGARFYRLLGIGVAIVAAASLFWIPLGPAGDVLLSAGIAYKGIDVLGTLATEGKSDPDWKETRSRAIVGIVVSVASFIISGLWVILLLVATSFRR